MKRPLYGLLFAALLAGSAAAEPMTLQARLADDVAGSWSTCLAFAEKDVFPLAKDIDWKTTFAPEVVAGAEKQKGVKRRERAHFAVDLHLIVVAKIDDVLAEIDAWYNPCPLDVVASMRATARAEREVRMNEVAMIRTHFGLGRK